MTELHRCRWCRRALPESSGPGRPRQFCSQRCRQWDWVSRHRAQELELSEGELVVAKSTLDELHDELYVLACAVQDAEADLAAEVATGKPKPAELLRIIEWLLVAAKPLQARELPAAQKSPAPEVAPQLTS